ncbi:MAG: YceI family protein [Bacteroidota bacterium]
MKSVFLSFLILFALVATSIAQEYQPADQGSSVTFKIKNFGFNVEGSFSGLQGKIVFDPKDPAKASFDVSVDAASVNTDNSLRDGHLKDEDYFDVKNHARIRFVSTSVVAGKEGKYTVSGKLTIKSTTKDISIPFTASPMGNDYIFSGSFTINRRDFGVGGSSTISNSLTVTLTVLAKK